MELKKNFSHIALHKDLILSTAWAVRADALRKVKLLCFLPVNEHGRATLPWSSGGAQSARYAPGAALRVLQIWGAKGDSEILAPRSMRWPARPWRSPVPSGTALSRIPLAIAGELDWSW